MAVRIKVNLDGTIDYGGRHYVPRERCIAEPDYDMDEEPQARWWVCHRCDMHFLMERGAEPSFCPRCGAEVV